MNGDFAAALRVLPDYLGHHVRLSAAALALGLIISLPLAVAASRSARLRWPLLTVASIIQTIPSLALLALFYPLLLVLSSASQALSGHGFSALGFLPALAALTLYSMLPILRNTVTGILALDPGVIEAARGVGMTDGQRLRMIELPLAAPVIMAGIRTAAVWVIGTATLATPVGQVSLGNYIFSGLQTENWVWVLVGCIAAAVLALVVDQLLALIEAGFARRSGWRIWCGIAGLAIGVMLALTPWAGSARATYVIGAKNFSEQYILGALIADRLEQQGQTTSLSSGLGSAVIFRALANNDIDVYVDYSGTVWANVMNRSDHPPREEMLREMADWLRQTHGVVLLGALGFENAYALAMRSDRAAELGIKTIADLARHAPQLSLGTDYEFLARADWKELQSGYGLRFASSRQFQSTFMYKALVDGEVDVISAFSSDGRIAAELLTVLDDPLHKIPPYDAIVLIAPKRANDPVLRAALQPLIGAIPIERMRDANMMVDRDTDKQSPAAAAHWLAEQAGLEKKP
jgi:osmoprotectant transport system permease protein